MLMKTNSFNLATISILIFTMIGLLSSCKTKIEIEENEIITSCLVSTEYIYFKSSDKWQVWPSTKGWLTCSKTTGEAGEDNYVKLSIRQNFDIHPRQCYVYIESGNNKDSVLVIQKGNDQELGLISSSQMTEDSHGWSQVISFCALNDWTITSNVDWIILGAKNGGSGVQHVMSSLKENSSYESRGGQVIIKTKNRKEIVYITQKGKEIRNKDWRFSDYNSQETPTIMEKGNERYIFDNANKTITYYENNRRLKAYIYETELADPRQWDMATKDMGLVKEYKYTVEGVLYKASYKYGHSDLYYAEVDIEEGGYENPSTWEIYKKKSGVFDDKILQVDVIYNFLASNEYKIIVIDKSTGEKRQRAILEKMAVKDYVLNYLKEL